MKQLIVTVALIILGVYIANTLILDDTNSMMSSVKSIAIDMMTELNSFSN
ncbi:MAG: hypothetical protein AB7V16_04470 [Vulcanibacillus sp.]